MKSINKSMEDLENDEQLVCINHNCVQIDLRLQFVFFTYTIDFVQMCYEDSFHLTKTAVK